MPMQYMKDAIARAERAAKLAERLKGINEAMEAMPDEEEAEALFAADHHNLQIAIYTEDGHLLKAPVPVGDQMRLFAILRSSLQAEQTEALGMMLREMSSDTKVN